MKKITTYLVLLTLTACIYGIAGSSEQPAASAADTEKSSVSQKTERESKMDSSVDKMPQTEAEWKAVLTTREYFVLRRKGTERPFSGKYDKFFKPGTYKCAGCGNILFLSDDKFDSGCGWPAFSAPAEQSAVKESIDRSYGMIRTEITCAKCGGHLGHVFNDGPGPTGLRYCINSASLDFQKPLPVAADPNELKVNKK